MAKVILDKDIVKLGREGDVKNVADGFARNYLLPRRLATLFTPGTARALEGRKAGLSKKREAAAKQADQIKASTQMHELFFDMNVDDKGELYGSINKGQILKALRAKGIRLPHGAKLQLASPLRTLGNFKVPLWLPANIMAEISVTLASSASPQK